jgi:hypothetical protein
MVTDFEVENGKGGRATKLRLVLFVTGFPSWIYLDWPLQLWLGQKEHLYSTFYI